MNRFIKVIVLFVPLSFAAINDSIAQTSGSVSAGNWYRIASNTGDRANAEFTLRDFISSGGHSTVHFRVGISFNYESGMSFILLNHSYYSQITFSKVRILESSTYDDQYLEVYVNRSGSVDFSIYDNLQNSGWQAVAWTSGNVPSGYTVREFVIDKLFSVGGNGTKFTINRDGKTGVGTTSPTSKLHVAHSGLEDGVKIETTTSDENTAKLQILYNFNSSSASRNAAIELGRDISDSGSHKWRLRANSTYTWGNSPNFFLEYLSGGVYNKFFTIQTSGNVGIGTTSPDYKLDVLGTIRAQEVKVATGWSDFVFESDYKLPTLQEVENYIDRNGHLPDIPSAEEVEKNGISLGEMDSKLLQKIEELTLYVIEQNEKLEAQSMQLNTQSKKLKELRNENEELKKHNEKQDKLLNHLIIK